MIDINIGWRGDDFVKNLFTICIKKNHVVKYYSQQKMELWEDKPVITNFVWNTIQPLITDEREITINVMGKSYNITLGKLALDSLKVICES